MNKTNKLIIMNINDPKMNILFKDSKPLEEMIDISIEYAFRMDCS